MLSRRLGWPPICAPFTEVELDNEPWSCTDAAFIGHWSLVQAFLVPILYQPKQSHISKKNANRLRTLAQSENERIAKLAAVMLEVARFAPYRRRRMRNLAHERRDVLRRMEEAGLVLPRPVWENNGACDDDPFAAWDE